MSGLGRNPVQGEAIVTESGAGNSEYLIQVASLDNPHEYGIGMSVERAVNSAMHAALRHRFGVIAFPPSMIHVPNRSSRYEEQCAMVRALYSFWMSCPVSMCVLFAISGGENDFERFLGILNETVTVGYPLLNKEDEGAIREWRKYAPDGQIPDIVREYERSLLVSEDLHEVHPLVTIKEHHGGVRSENHALAYAIRDESPFPPRTT